jgi:nitroimidazol reductase NimA-like FMN-containing flavoprotein (pyridoxamine 5'-phosphate oxidase superfamily)
MRDQDEPMLGRGREPTGGSADSVEARIRALLARERFAVLCTQGEEQPYGSVVAVAADDRLRHVVFATGRATRKYRLLEGCDRVALVLDDRDRHPDELMSVEAVTATGRASEVRDPGDHECWKELLVSRHPALQSFLEAPSTALFRVDIVRYLHVWRFQEVRQWVPTNRA